VYGIEKYRAQTWKITRVSRRASGVFAIRHVLYPASGMRRRRLEMQHARVLQMVHRLHKIWFKKAKSLFAEQLWRPGGMDTRTGTLLTMRRVMHCRPSCVFYMHGNNGRLRPCRRDRFCPFCWARTAASGYRLYKHEIRQARKDNPRMVLVGRVISHKFTARDFNPAAGCKPEQLLSAAQELRAVLEKHVAAYKPLAKQLQRKVLGSAWRVAVNPCDDGWQVEARQLFLCRGKQALPLIRYTGAKTDFYESVCVHDEDEVAQVLGKFFEYPAGLLAGYSELAAVYLQASSNMRTSSGTGVFRATGQSLVRRFKKADSHGARKPEPEPQAPEELGGLPPDVPV